VDDTYDQDLVEAVQRFAAPVFTYSPKPQEIMFARAFALEGDLEKAWHEARLPSPATETKASLMAKATRLLATDRVQERHRYFKQLIAHKMDAREDRIMAELSALSFSDVADYYDEQGKLLPPHKIPAHARAAIKSYDANNQKITMIDKLGSLRTLVSIKNMDSENMAAKAPKIVIGLPNMEALPPAAVTIEHEELPPQLSDEELLG